VSAVESLPDLSSLSDAQLRRLAYSLWDFQQSLSALTFLMEDYDFDAKYTAVELRRFRCFESTVIISFARPFEGSRGQTVLGLRAIGIQLTEQEKQIHKRLMMLRRKVVAHSDDDEMHFNVQLIRPMEDSELRVPLFNFQESLYLTSAELRPLETFLRRLTHAITGALFRLAQSNPNRIEGYRIPSTL
jgi:hypothetical protein